MIENTTKHRVRRAVADMVGGEPQLAAVLEQHTKNSTLWLRQLHQLTGNLKKNEYINTRICSFNVHSATFYSHHFCITCLNVVTSVGACESVSWSSWWWNVTEMKPFKAGQKSWALVLSPCTSLQLRLTASTQSTSSWNNNCSKHQSRSFVRHSGFKNSSSTCGFGGIWRTHLKWLHLWQHCLHKGEHRQHQATGQQRQSLYTAAQSSLSSLRHSGDFYRVRNSNSLNQEAQTHPLVS